MKKIHSMMQQALEKKVFPGGVLLAAGEGEIRFFRAYGFANIYTGRKMKKDTVFDLASLTKALATTLVFMKLADSGKMDTEQTLKNCLPESAGSDKAKIRIRHLLTHSAAYPAHRPYYLQLDSFRPETRKSALRKMLLREKLPGPPETKTLYSDLGFMLLEWIAEKAVRLPPDRFLAENIYGPLGISSLFFQSGDAVRKGDFAATEFCPWRKRLLTGEVHDENAGAVGGAAGHAGLFGTAESVFHLTEHLLECFGNFHPSPLFSADTVRYFLQPFGDTGRSLGFDRPAPRGASCGDYFSENTVGHLGFTGTSFWMDLERSSVVILLTNRVHPFRENIRIRKFRPSLHNAVMETLFVK